MAKKRAKRVKKKPPIYDRLLQAIFDAHYKDGTRSFQFKREEIEKCAKKLRIELPKNLGDLIYTFRYRKRLPEGIASKAPEGFEWMIAPAGRSLYRFKLVKIIRIVPAENQYTIKIPDATPEIVARYALSDEQALLAKVRYNRLIDTFLRVTAYSLQNHCRTTIPGIGQMETDEMYVGVRNTGEQFIIPVQAKTHRDHIGPVQIAQDIAMCRHRYPQLTCRPVAVQFSKDSDGQESIVMFELIEDAGAIKVADQRQYRLVPSDEISAEDLAAMGQLA